MTNIPSCTLYSRDEEIVTLVKGYLDRKARVRHVEDEVRFLKLVDQLAPSLVIIDLHTPGAMNSLRHICKSLPGLLVIALGDPTGEPGLEAEELGAYALESRTSDRRSFQAATNRAFKQLDLQKENLNLREQIHRDPPATPPPSPPPSQRSVAGQVPLGSFSRTLRHMGNLQALLESIVEGVASASFTSRVGVFMRSREDGVFRLAAGIRCLPDTFSYEYAPGDELVQWLEMHACQVARANLEHVQDVHDRLVLNQELESLGAELIIPLLGRRELMGFLFVGTRSTGIPFSYHDLEDFMVFSEHISVTLENALLYEEIAEQKTMAETLLHSMPTGICAIDIDGHIKAFNRAAEEILGVEARKVLQEHASCLGSQLADALLSGLDDRYAGPIQWTDPKTQKSLVVESRSLRSEDQCRGAVALIHDISEKAKLREKEEQVERATFWNDLAASMSHEIRNPLVAIKTFAQLLPERYSDAEFRAEFSDLVSSEVDRLNSIIEQIDDFAHPGDLEFDDVSLPEVLQAGLDLAKSRTHINGMEVKTSFDPDLPRVEGDKSALTECFAQVISNAMEALDHKKEGVISLRAHRKRKRNGKENILVTVEDNGPGLEVTIKEKVFSPFCTTKMAGMGLGLPIAKRTVIDHNGQIQIDELDPGTRVTIALPARKKRGVK